MSYILHIGLYGSNGHQYPLTLPSNVRASVVAIAGLPAEIVAGLDVTVYPDLDTLLLDDRVELVSLCSPRRSEQAQDAIRCLRAGKNVLAEKPGAFNEDELTEILATMQQTGKSFREMNGASLAPQLQGIRQLVDAGELGTVVHVQAQKSYPWYAARPQDMDTDGGLTRWVGIHAIRFIIAATGLRFIEICGAATSIGNPGVGDIQMAAAYSARLDNGAIASINLNYLNPPEFGSWGNDHIRVTGTRGMAESVDGFVRSNFYQLGNGVRELPPATISTDHLEHYVNYLLDGTPMPTSFADELAALRTTFAAHQAAQTGATVTIS